jgi:hypothetical protein
MLASRDLIVNDMEIAVEGAQLDGMVCLSSCDKTPPAHLMAAGRFNIPTILVICGYQPTGLYQGKHVDIEEVFIGSVQAMFGKLSKETLGGMCDHAITGPGVCAGMGTANSMHIVCEALGMTLPGAAPVLANSPKMFDLARASGRRIVEMVNEDLTPRQILTPGAFRNAAASVLAVSGSINCVKHLQATAVEAGVDDAERVALAFLEAEAARPAVLEGAEGHVAGGTQHRARSREARLEKQLLAERDGFRPSRDPVAGIGLEPRRPRAVGKDFPDFNVVEVEDAPEDNRRRETVVRPAARQRPGPSGFT